MKPYVVCHMIASLDGRILPGRWTESPDGDRKAWTTTYAAIHESLAGEAWLVGRVTMAELSPALPHPPATFATPSRANHFAPGRARPYAIAVDPSGKLHFDRPDIDGDAIVVLLGRDVGDAHLAELAADGVSYIVSPTPDIDLAAALDDLGRELGVRRLILEGGGGVNGAFLAAGLVDEVSLLIAPTLDGGEGSRSLAEFRAGLKGKTQLSLTSCERFEHGLVRLIYAARRQRGARRRRRFSGRWRAARQRRSVDAPRPSFARPAKGAPSVRSLHEAGLKAYTHSRGSSRGPARPMFPRLAKEAIHRRRPRPG